MRYIYYMAPLFNLYQISRTVRNERVCWDIHINTTEGWSFLNTTLSLTSAREALGKVVLITDTDTPVSPQELDQLAVHIGKAMPNLEA